MAGESSDIKKKRWAELVWRPNARKGLIAFCSPATKKDGYQDKQPAKVSIHGERRRRRRSEEEKNKKKETPKSDSGL